MQLKMTVEIPDSIENPRNIAFAIALTADAFNERLGVEPDFDVDEADKNNDGWQMAVHYLRELGKG